MTCPVLLLKQKNVYIQLLKLTIQFQMRNIMLIKSNFLVLVDAVRARKLRYV